MTNALDNPERLEKIDTITQKMDAILERARNGELPVEEVFLEVEKMAKKFLPEETISNQNKAILVGINVTGRVGEEIEN
jgi:hypothetical protein